MGSRNHPLPKSLFLLTSNEIVMRLKNKLFTAWLGFHLFSVVLIAFELVKPEQLPDGVIKSTLQLYAGITGSTQYIFFSPKVASDVRVNFFFMDQKDSIYSQALIVNSTEAVLRTYSMTMFFQANKDMRDFIAQSWAATIYGYHPDAKQVIVSVHIHQLPTMVEYAAGARPEWVEFYRTVYELEPAENIGQGAP